MKDGAAMCRPLHERLRLARELRGLSLVALAREHGVREQNFLLIEKNAFEELPTGLYGRHAVRAYATAVGISGDEALAEVQHRLREVEDPLDGLARVRGLERQKPLRIDVAPAVERPIGGGLAWRGPVAALIDGGILLGIAAALVGLTALTAGVGVGAIVRQAAPALALVYLLIAASYFVLLGGIRKATIGARITQAPASADLMDGADAHAVMQRGLQCLLSESSSLANWVVTTEHARHLVRTLRERRA